MKAKKALKLLRGGEDGIAEWNALRRNVIGKYKLSIDDLRRPDFDIRELDTPERRLPNLTGADLEAVDLSGADLSSLELEGANLRGASLSNADLGGANLSNSDLSLSQAPSASFLGTRLFGAKLETCNLYYAELKAANLREANLSGAFLLGTSLRDLDLAGADFTDALFGETLVSSDLSAAKGLDATRHQSPSYLTVSAMEQLQEPYPLVFLKGCGVSDAQIEFYRSQLGAIRYYSAFLSYSSQDEEFAQRLYNDLQGSGVRCWFAPHDLKIGDRPMVQINEAIRMRDKLILILSEHSIESDWVEHELKKAIEEEQRRETDVLFPIRLDDAVQRCEFGWAKRLREAHKPGGRLIGDFSQWRDYDDYQRSLERLLRDLKPRSTP